MQTHKYEKPLLGGMPVGRSGLVSRATNPPLPSRRDQCIAKTQLTKDSNIFLYQPFTQTTCFKVATISTKSTWFFITDSMGL